MYVTFIGGDCWLNLTIFTCREEEKKMSGGGVWDYPFGCVDVFIGNQMVMSMFYDDGVNGYVVVGQWKLMMVMVVDSGGNGACQLERERQGVG